MSDNTDRKTAILDIAKSLKGVFKKYSRSTREYAWNQISNAKGKSQVHKLIVDPNINLNTFQKLIFREWLEADEMSLTTLAREQFKRDVAKALLDLKQTAPEVFEWDAETGSPKKIKANQEEMEIKLNDRGLIPSNCTAERFIANLRMFVNNPGIEIDPQPPRGEGIAQEHLADAIRMRTRLQDARMRNRAR